mmetsp:Transcript_95176/g.159808  ORF Transcript_95176/g.159808 Transcript_95176/m.159808 type:complete len:177 (+) Transcript_95176:2810-3340(+)
MAKSDEEGAKSGSALCWMLIAIYQAEATGELCGQQPDCYREVGSKNVCSCITRYILFDAALKHRQQHFSRWSCGKYKYTCCSQKVATKKLTTFAGVTPHSSMNTDMILMVCTTSHRPLQPLGRTTVSPDAIRRELPSEFVRKHTPSSTWNTFVLDRLPVNPPGVHVHTPKDVGPTS